MNTTLLRNRGCLALVVIFLACILIAVRAEDSLHEGDLRPLVVGGHIPNWLIKYEPGVNAPISQEQMKELPGYQKSVQQRANELFDVVIPGYLTWKASEPQAGQLDFRMYDAAAAWAVQNHKKTIVQHLFWEDPRTIPDWAKSLNATELGDAMRKRISYTREHIGDVYGLTVINEMLYFHFLRDHLGGDVVKSVFGETRKAFPHTLLYLDENPWQRDIDQHDPNPARTGMERLSKLVNELQAEHVPFDRVGIQLYVVKEQIEEVGGVDAAVGQFKEAIDAFKKATGQNITVLEFGITTKDEDYRENFVKKMLEMCRENRSVDGFFFYHWLDEQLPGNALVLKDGSLTPAGQALLSFRKGQGQ